jgi:hypothetical protein
MDIKVGDIVEIERVTIKPAIGKIVKISGDVITCVYMSNNSIRFYTHPRYIKKIVG